MFFLNTPLKATLCVTIAILSISACNNGSSKQTATPTAIATPTATSTPMVIAQDSSKIFLEDFNRQIGDYINYLWNLNPQDIAIEQKNLLSLAERYDKEYPQSKVIELVAERFENLLYDPNSPYRNEEIFLHIAEYMSSYQGIDSISRVRFQQIANDCSLNRLGEVVTDFTYATLNDGESTLHSIKSDYVFLFFSNPGCNSCFNIIQSIKSSEKITRLQKEGRLTILNMYIDEDLENWIGYMKEYPKNWINAYDPNISIKNNKLYSIRAIPSIYLLDKEKRAILKDAPENIALNILENID